MKRIYGGWWFRDLGTEINLNIFLGFLAAIIFFGSEIVRDKFLIYIIMKGLSLFAFIYHLAFSIILGKMAAEKIYK